MKKSTKFFIAALFSLISVALQASPIESIVTPYTITRVRGGEINGKDVIVAGSYEGNLLCYDYSGKLLWENKLSGFFNHDFYCGDIDGDKSDEVLVANATGKIYCLDSDGSIMWEFSKNDAPMYAVTLIHKDGKPYVACGGYDRYLYYLDAKGNEVSKVLCDTFSKASAVGLGGPGGVRLMTNLLRPALKADGSEVLAMYGSVNSMADKGYFYMFEPLAAKPYSVFKQSTTTVYGSLGIDNSNPKEGSKLLIGSTKMTNIGYVNELSIDGKEEKVFSIRDLGDKRVGSFGYRVAQCEVVKMGDKYQRFIIFGSSIMLPTDENIAKTTEVIECRFAFYDLATNSDKTKVVLASAQSGGSAIHILDLANNGWKSAFEKLVPEGKITQMLNNTETVIKALPKFELPKWENLNSRPVVCFMSENPQRGGFVGEKVASIHKNYPSPIFLNGGSAGGTENPALWNRDTMSNEWYKTRRDKRQSYKNTQEQILKNVARAYEGDSKGMSMWGGHGNDPFYYSPDTHKKILDFTGIDQQTVLIFPEMEGRGPDVAWPMNTSLYPLAQHAREHNSKMFIRSKHIFWLGNIYEHHWNRLVSGEFADVFVPSMEETTDKSMELSLMGRLGIWMSGATDSWGSRCARDNASYDRLRQHSQQNLPNGFLRNMVYHISLGAQYLDNFPVDQEYMSLLWDMIAKGILYVPKRDEIVSLNPVRLTMLEPDQAWLDEGNNVKWTTLYDEQKEKENPWVMGRLNGSWPAAPTTEWDFSRYAAGATERRLNFVSSFNNGHVIIAPPFDASAPRGTVEEHINPIYKGKTKEFFTDGRNYYSDAAKTKSYSPKEYYKVVEEAIIEGAKMMPLTVKGEVGWVAAQSSPKHLRVTIIDGGYINPSDKTATIVIGTAKVKKITDLLSGQEIKLRGGKCSVEIPCGLFKFLDIELSEELK